MKKIFNKVKERMKAILKNKQILKLKVLKRAIEGEKGSKRKHLVDFCCIIFVIFYFVIFVIRFFIAASEIFQKVFPHCAMSEDVFYERYKCNLSEITFFKRLYYFWLDFIAWDLSTMLFKVALLLLLFFIIYLFVCVFLNKKEKEKFFIKNTDINLFCYNFMLNILVEKIRTEKEFSFEDFGKIKSYIIENIIELYFIVKEQPAQELLKFVIIYKKNKIVDLEKNPNEIQQVAFVEMEEKFLNKLIMFLQEKERNKEQMSLEFEDFVKEFSRIDE